MNIKKTWLALFAMILMCVLLSTSAMADGVHSDGASELVDNPVGEVEHIIGDESGRLVDNQSEDVWQAVDAPLSADGQSAIVEQPVTTMPVGTQVDGVMEQAVCEPSDNGESLEPMGFVMKASDEYDDFVYDSFGESGSRIYPSGSTCSLEWDRSEEIVSWTSSNEKVLRVVEGYENWAELLLLEEGTAKLTVRLTTGEKYKLSIKVVDHYKPVSIVFDEGSSLFAVVGESQYLTPILTPQTARTTLTWSSSKPQVTTVDAKGMITCLSEGKARITARTHNKKKATITINVVDPYKPAAIEFAEGSCISTIMGELVQLDAMLTPGTAHTTLTWTSSKPKVATVDANGLVTPRGEGRTKITVRTHNKKKATITIDVLDPYKPKDIEISEGKKLLLAAGQSIQLTPVLTPYTAQTTLRWSSNKPKVAVVDGTGLVKAIESGNAKITVMTDNGKKASIKLKVEGTSSVAFPFTSSIEFRDGGDRWGEWIYVNSDWSFNGELYENLYRADTGETGSRYALFSGQFTDVEKLDDYTYRMRVNTISKTQQGDEYADVDFYKNDVVIMYLAGTHRTIPDYSADGPYDSDKYKHCALYNETRKKTFWD